MQTLLNRFVATALYSLVILTGVTAIATSESKDNTIVQDVSGLCFVTNTPAGEQLNDFKKYANYVCAHYRNSTTVIIDNQDWQQPWSKEFVASLKKFIKESSTIDLYVIGETNEAAARFKANDLIDSFKGKLRFAINSGSFDAKDSEVKIWSTVAQTFVGHKGNNAASMYTIVFLKSWLEGTSVADSLDSANDQMLTEPFSTLLQGADSEPMVTGNKNLRLNNQY